MKNMVFLFFFGVILISGLPGQDMPADQMLREIEERMYPDTFRMITTMKTERPGGRDSNMTLEVFHQENEGTFMEILSPSRSRGTRFLQKGDDLWMYIPKSNSRRAIRLSPKESFQNSVFSNNDVSDLNYNDDYAAEYGEPENISHPSLGNITAYVLTAEASHEKSPYGKIIMWIRKEDHMPLKMDFYAKSGTLFKRMILSEFKDMAGKNRPGKMEMISIVQKDAHTILTIEEMEQKESIPNRYFNLSNLTR
jgi:outer membrane lipoprotein-sorting protein